MRHAFTIGGTDIEVWLTRDGTGYRLSGDAGGARVDLVPTGDGAYTLSVDGLAQPVLLAVEGEDLHVHIAGRTHALRHLDPTRRFADAASAGGGDVARAPMPGTVVRIDVAAGQAVVAGDALVVIESMKLETTIRAWHDGVVAALHVVQGQSFDRDAPLVTVTAGG
ncbi:MAG: acetyl-CoA carboxylase biotin carboxyl carrier protein subunit [Alsobacter sp.]